MTNFSLFDRIVSSVAPEVKSHVWSHIEMDSTNYLFLFDLNLINALQIELKEQHSNNVYSC